MGFAFGQLIPVLISFLIPLLVLGWLVSMITRAVKALESIAASLRERNR